MVILLISTAQSHQIDMDFLLIVLIIIIAIAIIIFATVSHIKKIESLKYYAAAQSMLREDFLNYSLQNHMLSEGNLPIPNGRKTMVFIKAKGVREKFQFVFDPEKTILIGRDKENSNIYLNDIAVSQTHCRIFSENDVIYLQDMNSINGTVIKRNFLKRYNVHSGCTIMLKNNDRVIAGSCEFKIVLFYFDMSTM